MKIYLGSDHAGFDLKEAIKHYLSEGGHEVVDCGNTQLDRSDNYVEFVTAAARQAAQDPAAKAIIFGGSGQGEAIAANRLHNVRAAVYYAPGNARELDVSGAPSAGDGFDIVRLSRLHNDSNVLSLGARFITFEQAKAVIGVWLETEFSGDQRHIDRNRQLDALEP